jgi:hypothetical protein
MMFLELDYGKGQLVNLLPMDLVLDVMEPQGNYMKELYDPGDTNSHGCFIVTFPALHVYFISNMHIL